MNHYISSNTHIYPSKEQDSKGIQCELQGCFAQSQITSIQAFEESFELCLPVDFSCDIHNSTRIIGVTKNQETLLEVVTT